MKFILIILFVQVSLLVKAQEKINSNPNAVYSIDGIVKEILQIISGEEGKVRDWDAFRNLFLPTANFTVLSHDTLSLSVETVSLEEFIELMHNEYYDQGFTENEISKVVEEYNGIAQVFQTYYGKDSENYEENGITSYQLVQFKDRWWIVNILWTGDSNGVNVPEKYLRN